MDHVDPAGGDGFDFHVQQLGHVNRREAGTDQPQPVQPLQRADTEAGIGFADFVLGLVDMHVHLTVQFFRQRGNLFQALVADGIGGMRGKRRVHQSGMPQCVPGFKALFKILLGGGGPGSGKLDRDHAHGCAHAGGLRTGSHRIGKEVHVLETRGAAPHHLQHGQIGAHGHVVPADPACLSRPDILVQPLHQRQVVGVSAQQRHRGMGVGIDQPGNEDVVIQFHNLVGLPGPDRFRARPRCGDPVLDNDDGMVLVNRARVETLPPGNRDRPPGQQNLVRFLHDSNFKSRASPGSVEQPDRQDFCCESAAMAPGRDPTGMFPNPLPPSFARDAVRKRKHGTSQWTQKTLDVI